MILRGFSRRRAFSFMLVAIFLASAACGEGNKTEPAVATTMAANSQTDLSTIAGFEIFPPPSVIVRDQNGNPFAGAPVTFTPVTGDGTVTGGSVITDTTGVATVGSWTLGLTPGPNVLVARSGILSVSFSATGISKCDVPRGFDLGNATGAILDNTDCRLPNGAFIDYFSISLPSPNAYLFRQVQSSINPYLRLLLPDRTVIAENDDQNPTTLNAAIKALLPAGTYLLGASTSSPGVTGGYSLSSEVASTDNKNCELVFITRNVSSIQNIAASDCLWNAPPASPIYADKFQIRLNAGESVTVNMTSAFVDSYVEIQDVTGTVIGQNDNRDATTNDARLTFTATATGYFAIVARTAAAAQGQYTLMVQ
jgi:hypothetical protein